jgi:Helix-turn-helix domain
MDPIEQEYLSPKQCAQLTGLSYEGLRRMRREGRGPSWCRPAGQRKIFYSRAAVRAWMLGATA